MWLGVPEMLWGRGAHPHPPPHPQSCFSPLWTPKALLKGDEAHFYGADHVDGGSLQPYGAGGSILTPPRILKAPFPLYGPPKHFLKGVKPISMGQTMRMGVPEALWGRGAHPQPPPPSPKPLFPFMDPQSTS